MNKKRLNAFLLKQGAAVLMMLESFMGPENFQKGIQDFLKEYKFKNAATADLWRVLQVRKKKLLNEIFFFFFL